MKRSTMRSSKGKKLYAVRDSKGHFKDIQTYKRAHSADIRHTAKGEKRQRLISYITAFWITTSGNNDSRKYNIAWERMMKKIDALKLFAILALIFSVSLAQAGDFKLIDPAHPKIATGIFSDLKGHSDAGGALALITCAPAAWVPLSIGGSLGKGLGGPSLGLGSSVNILPAVKTGALQVLNALFPSTIRFSNLKTILEPTVSGAPDITMSFGPAFALVFVDGFKTRGAWLLFYGADWKF